MTSRTFNHKDTDYLSEHRFSTDCAVGWLAMQNASRLRRMKRDAAIARELAQARKDAAKMSEIGDIPPRDSENYRWIRWAALILMILAGILMYQSTGYLAHRVTAHVHEVTN